MGFNRFSLLIISRTLLILLSLLLLAYFIITPGFHAAILLMSLLLVIQFHYLIRFVRKTNAELTRFLDAARYADYSQRFSLPDVGAGFEELGKVFDEIIKKLQSERNQQQLELRQLKALVEHVPVPLLSLSSNQQLTLWNNAARRLFGSNSVTKLKDLAQFNPDFPKLLTELAIGENCLVEMQIDGMTHQLSIATTQLNANQQQETLLSMQDIQNELDRTQLQAWQELVRVLTHEIMNSITPVASLAQTAAELTKEIQTKSLDSPEISEELQDVTDAVQTVATRSKGLMNFVSSYRQLTKLPAPTLKTIKVTTLLTQVQQLATQNWAERGIQLSISVTPKELDFTVDVNMIEQLLLNLLQNAEHALIDAPKPQVSIQGQLNKRGRIILEISDNGCGIANDTLDKIFVPFFTTKRNGSGVGLALSRQIMLTHGGNIKAFNNSKSGATFSLLF